MKKMNTRGQLWLHERTDWNGLEPPLLFLLFLVALLIKLTIMEIWPIFFCLKVWKQNTILTPHILGSMPSTSWSPYLYIYIYISHSHHILFFIFTIGKWISNLWFFRTKVLSYHCWITFTLVITSKLTQFYNPFDWVQQNMFLKLHFVTVLDYILIIIWVLFYKVKVRWILKNQILKRFIN